jgi:serine/threonine-protein kinase
MAKFHQIAGYDVVSTLGTGAGSTLYAVRDRKGEVFCLKQVVKKSQEHQRYLDQAVLEHEIARKFDHPQLRKSLKLIKVRELIRVSEVLVLMEMVDGLTLEQHKPPDMLEMCKVCRLVASALLAMHRAGYVHADIKPNNIMITAEGVVKIIDFGQSCPIGTIKERIQGTPDYIAPEQVKRQAITEQTDVYNFGATMYWMLTSKNVPTMIPKKGNVTVGMKTESYGKCEPPIELNPKVTPALSQLVMDCIEKKTAERPPGMASVIDRLDLAIAQVERMYREQGKAISADFSESTKPAPQQPASSDTRDLDLNDTAELDAAQMRQK